MEETNSTQVAMTENAPETTNAPETSKTPEATKTPKTSKTPKAPKNSKKKTLKISAIVLAILAVGLISFYLSEKTGNNNAVTMVDGLSAEEVITDELSANASSEASSDSASPKTEGTTSTQTARGNVSSNGRYHVIIGSFVVPENATNLAAKVRSEFPSAQTLPNDGNTHVSVGSFATFYQAADFIKTDSRMSGFEGAWVRKL